LAELARRRLAVLRPPQAQAQSLATKKTLDELAEKYADDFEGFCGLLQVVPKEGGARIPFVLSPTQQAIQAVRSPRMILCKGRQVRATTIEVARDLWWFLTKRGARVVVVCQSAENETGVKDIVYKIDVFLDSLATHGYVFDFGREQSKDWTLPSRDATLRVIQAGASEKSATTKGRGGTVNRLHMTEMGLWGDYAHETFNSLTKSVPEHGSEIINETTPRGAYGFYFEQWQAAVGGTSAFVPHFFGWWLEHDYKKPLEAGETLEPLSDVERGLAKRGASLEAIKWRRWQIRENGGNEELVNQEFPNDPHSCFLVEGRGFFDEKVTTKLYADATAPIRVHPIRGNGARGEIRFFANVDPRAEYIVVADTSQGDGGDPSAAHVYERVTGRHMATLDGQLDPWELGRWLIALAKAYSTDVAKALIVVERNNHGGTTLRCLINEKYPRIFKDRDDKYGWNNHEVSRTPALDTLERAHRRGAWSTRDALILAQFRTFVVNARGRAEAARGSHDEHPICAAIGWDVLTRSSAARTEDEETTIVPV
jgi:hypothetical protein